MKLHKLHILQRHAGARRHTVAVAGAGMGGRAREVSAAVTAGCQNHHIGAEDMDGAVIEVPGHDAATDAFIIHQQVDREVLDEKIGVVLQALLIKRVQNGMTGAVGGGAGALYGRFAVILHMAAEGALIDAAILGARKRHAVMFQFINGLRAIGAHILNRILVAEPVGALDRVVHMPAPVVLLHIAERRADAALGGDRVAASRKYLGDASGAQAGRLAAQGRRRRRRQPRHGNVLRWDKIGAWRARSAFVWAKGLRASGDQPENATLSTAITEETAQRKARSFTARIEATLVPSSWT